MRIVRYGLLIAAVILLAGASALDIRQLLDPTSGSYFYAARWMGTGLAMGFVACALFFSLPRFDPTVAEKGPGFPGFLALSFYGASWAIRKHYDRHLTDLSVMLSMAGLLAMLLVVALSFTNLFRRPAVH